MPWGAGHEGIWRRHVWAPDKYPKTVYLIANDDIDIHKIGYSTDVDKRLKALRCQVGCELALVGLWRGTRSLESYLHMQYSQYRRPGEWFKFPGWDNETIEDVLVRDVMHFYRTHPFEKRELALMNREYEEKTGYAS